jgi:hypothetical protein
MKNGMKLNCLFRDEDEEGMILQIRILILSVAGVVMYGTKYIISVLEMKRNQIKTLRASNKAY